MSTSRCFPLAPFGLVLSLIATACHSDEPVDATAEMLGVLPSTATSYGCTYGAAAEFAAKPIEAVFADRLEGSELIDEVITSDMIEAMAASSGSAAATVIETLLSTVPTFETTYRNPRTRIVGHPQRTILQSGESAQLARVRMEFEIRALGGGINPEEQAWIARTMDLEFPVTLGLDGNLLTAQTTAVGAEEIQTFALEGTSSDPLADFFQDVADLGGIPLATPQQQANTIRTLFGLALGSADLSAEIEIPLDQLPIAELDIALIVSQSAEAGTPGAATLGDERVVLIASNNPTSCTGPFALTKAQALYGYASILIPPKTTKQMLRDQMAEAIENSGLEDLIAAQIKKAGFQAPPGTSFVPDPPIVTMNGDGFAVVIADIPSISQTRWISPFIDCDVTITINGQFSASFDFDFYNAYLHAEATPSGGLVLEDVSFSGCYGVDSIQEDIWEGTIVDGPTDALIDFVGIFGVELPEDGVADMLEDANDQALATMNAHLIDAALALEEKLNDLPAQLDEGGILLAPVNYMVNHHGVRTVGPAKSSLPHSVKQVGPLWPDFEWFMKRPSIALDVTDEASQIVGQASDTPWFSLTTGYDGSICNYTVETATHFHIIADWEADPGDYDAVFADPRITITGFAPFSDPEDPLVVEVPFHENGANTYSVTLDGTWQYADGRQVPMSETKVITLQGLEIEYETGCASATYTWLGELRTPIDPIDPLQERGIDPIERVSARHLLDPDSTPLTLFQDMSSHWFFRGTLPRDAEARLFGSTLPIQTVAREVHVVHVPADFMSSSSRDPVFDESDGSATMQIVSDRHVHHTFTLQFAAHEQFAEHR